MSQHIIPYLPGLMEVDYIHHVTIVPFLMIAGLVGGCNLVHMLAQLLLLPLLLHQLELFTAAVAECLKRCSAVAIQQYIPAAMLAFFLLLLPLLLHQLELFAADVAECLKRCSAMVIQQYSPAAMLACCCFCRACCLLADPTPFAAIAACPHER